MNLIVDTKEKSPLEFPTDYEIKKIYFDHLEAGDYTICGHDMPNDDFSIIIERKQNCTEFIRNLVAEWDRFERELQILSTYYYKQIVVCNPDNFWNLYNSGITKVHPNMAYKRIAEAYMKYGVSTIFFNSRQAATNYVYRLFVETLRLSAENDKI